MSSTIPPGLITAYSQAKYIVQLDDHELILRIDEYSQGLHELHRQYGARYSTFITACNPRSEIYPLEQNASRLKELRTDLESFDCAILAGIGLDPDGKWPAEPGFLVIGISKEDVFGLGGKYSQNAVVYSGEDALPRLILLK